MSHPRTLRRFAAGAGVLFALNCQDVGEGVPSGGEVSADAQLVAIFLRGEQYKAYRLFPDADSVTMGTLNGSNAHQPMVRVSMNDVAFAALGSGKLPQGSTFPDGSLIVKEIRQGGSTALFAVMYRDKLNPLSGQGWLWAEYAPDGSVVASIQSRGSGCVSCHSREQGGRNDLVRTFERQNP
jgi:hypothetical protein